MTQTLRTNGSGGKRNGLDEDAMGQPLAIWVKSAPDSLGRCHFVRYWPVDYLPGHFDGEGGLVRGQCYHAVPPADVHRFDEQPTARELHDFFYPTPATCRDCDGSGFDPESPTDEPRHSCRECGGMGVEPTKRQRPTVLGDGPTVSFDQTFDDSEVPW